jgi:hypothetical protein
VSAQLDRWLSSHLAYSQTGPHVLAIRRRVLDGAGPRVEPDPDIPAWWLAPITLPSGEQAHKFSPAGLIQLARVADWTQQRRTWGAQLVQDWMQPWQDHACMYQRGLELGAWVVGYGDPPPRLPPVTTWADEAAYALWSARGDHALALVQLAPTDPRIRWTLLLAPLVYREGLERWVELSRSGAFERGP